MTAARAYLSAIEISGVVYAIGGWSDEHGLFANVESLSYSTDGTCGSASGVAATSAPTTNLCATGTASSVTGSGPWSWTCQGSNGGTNASCSASDLMLLFTDDFNDGVLNPAYWTSRGQNVVEANGYVSIQENVTDTYSSITSADFPLSTKIRVEMRHYLHSANDYFLPSINFLYKDAAGADSLAAQLGWYRSAFSPDYCNISNGFDKVLMREGPSGTPCLISNVTSSSLYDQWITSYITYDAAAGKVEYDLGGDGSVDFVATISETSRHAVDHFNISGYGWWTGMYQNVDWIKVYTGGTLQDTTPPTTIPSRTGGSYASALSVTLNCNDGNGSGCANIYYTTNGNTPTTGSTLYTVPISITSTTTLKYFSVDKAGNQETAKSQTYNLYVCSGTGGTFTVTGDMTTTRTGHTATTLNNGKVLIAGGEDTGENAVNTAELFDPATGNFTATGTMTVQRVGHTAILLENGKILVVAGAIPYVAVHSSAELFDPVTNTFTATGSMTHARGSHTMTTLNDGKIAVIGGSNQSGVNTPVAELYNPVTGTFTQVGSLITPRDGHVATLLPDGKVFISGGYRRDTGHHLQSCEIFDPVTGTFTSAGNMGIARGWHQANLLSNGKVLIVGGDNDSGYTGTSEIFEPETGLFLAAASLNVARRGIVATPLPGGEILISGGFNGSGATLSALNTVEMYAPLSGTFTLTGNMNQARSGHAVALLQNGRVFVSGGGSGAWGFTRTTATEIFTPDNCPLLTINTKPTNPTTSTSASFTFSSTVPGATYQCKLDSGAWVSCSSPKSYTGLGISAHTFTVKALDSLGAVYGSPASYSWAIQLLQPAPSNIEISAPTVKGQLSLLWTNPNNASFSHIHIYRSTIAGQLGTLVADNLSGIKYTDYDLASQTRYYYTVRAMDASGNESTNTAQVSALTLDATPPGVPQSITATNTGSGGAILLGWISPSDSDFSHIHVYRSTTAGLLGSLLYDSVTGSSRTDSGLTNGTSYYYTIRAVDSLANETTNTSQVSATPSASDSIAPGLVSNVIISDPQTGSQLNLNWVNPTETDFAGVKIYRSTASGVLGVLAYTGSNTSYSDSGLTANVTYYYTLRSTDTAGNESTNINQYTGIPTDVTPPERVKDLRGTPLTGGIIRLDWVRSPSADINYYLVYSDGGSGTMDYITPLAAVAHPSLSWISASLNIGTRYQFAIRAEDRSGNMETNTSVVVSVVAVVDPAAGNVSARIKQPQAGKKIRGQQKLVMAELVNGIQSNVKEIQLQYKSVASGVWLNIPSINQATLPNPDPTSPYSIKWNIDSLGDGDYHLQAVAVSNALVADPDPSFITVTHDQVNPDEEESINNNRENQKSDKVNKNADNAVSMGGSTGITTITIPEGALQGDTTVTVVEKSTASAAPLVPASYGNGNSFMEVTFGNGQTKLQDDKAAIVEIPYQDSDNDGIIDGTSIKVYDLQVADYDTATGTWITLDSTVDTTNKTVKGKTTKFSLFGLLVPPKPVGSGWNLLSVPLQPTSAIPTSVFGQVTANAVQTWNPTTMAYAGVSTIEPGKAYWVIGNNNNLNVTGTETPNSNFSAPIKKGWNLIGQPFRYKVRISDMTIVSGGNFSIADAETAGLLVGTFYSYGNGAYQVHSHQDGDVLEAWKGYWLLSDVDGTLIIPPTPAP